MLNDSGPKIYAWGKPDIIFSHIMYEDPNIVLCFELRR